MTRFYLRLTILLIPLFTLLAIVMSALGSTQSPHPALQGFVEGCEDVPQPCWYGIVPGVTTVARAEMILMLHGFVSQISAQNTHYWYHEDWCYVRIGADDRGYLVWLLLEPCEPFSLKDVLEAIPSFPTYVGRTCNDDYMLPMGQMMIHTSGTMPTSKVNGFEFSTFPVGGRIMVPPSRWRGFWAVYPITGGAGCG